MSLFHALKVVDEHFRNASRYADLGILIRYTSIQRGRLSVSEKGRSHKRRALVNKECVIKLLPFSSAIKKQIVTLADVWAGALSCRSRTCWKPVTWRRFLIVFFDFFNITSS